jgi:hypothetical protein
MQASSAWLWACHPRWVVARAPKKARDAGVRQRPSPVCFGRSGVCRPKPQHLAAFKAATLALIGKHRGTKWHIDLALQRKKGLRQRSASRPGRRGRFCLTRLAKIAILIFAQRWTSVLAPSRRQLRVTLPICIPPKIPRTGSQTPCAGPFTKPSLFECPSEPPGAAGPRAEAAAQAWLGASHDVADPHRLSHVCERPTHFGR